MKKVLVLFLVLSILIIPITGCKTSDGNLAKNESTANEGKPEISKEVDKKQWPEPNTMPIVEEPIEIKMLVPLEPRVAQYAGGVENLQSLKDYEELTKIKIKWESAPVDRYEEVVNLMFASGDMADMVYVSPAQQAQFGVNDTLLIPLDDLLEQYGFYWNQWVSVLPDIKELAKESNGKTYVVPQIWPESPVNIGSGFFIRLEWMEKLGLEMPKTVDELYEVLVTFRDKDPAGNGETIPMAFRGFELYSIFGFWGTFPGFYQVDGVVKYGPLTDEFKQGLSFLRKCYDEGLLDRDYALSDEKLFNNNIVNRVGFSYGDVSVFQVPLLQAGYAPGVEAGPGIVTVNDVFYPMVAPTGPDGKYYSFLIRDGQIIQTNSIGITSTNKYPVESIKWLDYLLSFDGTMLVKFGPRGKFWDFNKEGYPMYKEGVNLEVISKYAPAFSQILPVIKNTYYDNKFPFTPERVLELPNKIQGYFSNTLLDRNRRNWTNCDFSRHLPLSMKFTPEQQAEVQSIMADIETYYWENVNKYIMGLEPLSNWDKVIEQIKAMNIERAIKLYQDALDRTKK
ncbi:MAG TPA: extracellular solute-binding protein [Clostridiaceae bacterium]|nr:extracellular solute-binding protein [Clostridiaceae bacterium]